MGYEMSDYSTRELTPSEEKFIADLLHELCNIFRVWVHSEGFEHDLIGFAYYEGCGGPEQPYSELLARASPFALGRELVSRHGFRWVMIASGSEWRYGVTHPALHQPIDLVSLEDGSWNHEEYDEPPDAGRMTHDSFDTIVAQVKQVSSRTR